MSRAFEELDHRNTPLGELILRRRLMPSLGDREVHEVILGDAFLMSDLFTEVEQALARLSLDRLDGEGLEIVVGGLGLGYTARAALESPRVGDLLVVDAMEAVIDWHRQGLVPLGEELSSDPRCRFVHGDFFALAANPALGFDLERDGRRFDAVLLDVDHSPRKLLSASHAPFYEVEGLGTLTAHLRSGGVFGLWSDDPPDADFLAALGQVFTEVEVEIVEFENPLQGGTSESTVYLARRR